MGNEKLHSPQNYSFLPNDVDWIYPQRDNADGMVLNKICEFMLNSNRQFA